MLNITSLCRTFRIAFEFIIQPDQINMAVLFWYLVKRYASVRFCTVAYTGQVTLLQGTGNTRPCLTGHPVDRKNDGHPGPYPRVSRRALLPGLQTGMYKVPCNLIFFPTLVLKKFDFLPQNFSPLPPLPH